MQGVTEDKEKKTLDYTVSLVESTRHNPPTTNEVMNI